MQPEGSSARIEAFSGWSKPSEPVQLVLTGGTIDARWAPERDAIISGGPGSVLAQYLEICRLNRPILCAEIAQKFSDELTSEDKSRLIAEVRAANVEASVVASGTRAIPELAARLNAHGGLGRGRRAVITGAKTPLVLADSDGPFNVGASLAALDNTKFAKVAACMDGRLVTGGDIDVLEGVRLSPSRGRSAWGSFRDLTVISAGGVINSQEDGLTGLRSGDRPYVADYLRDLKLDAKITYNGLACGVDGGPTRRDESLVAHAVNAAPTEKVLLTTSLFDMDRLAGSLRDRIRDKTVVITGARFSFAHRQSSATDAPFNLGYAYGRLATMKDHTVAVALGGHILAPDEKVLDLFTPEEQGRISELRDRGVKSRRSRT